jgi:hypothetical protein
LALAYGKIKMDNINLCHTGVKNEGHIYRKVYNRRQAGIAKTF